MSNHQSLHLTEAMNLIELRQQRWRRGPSTSVWNSQVRRPLPGTSLPNFLLLNTLFLLSLTHSQTHMEVRKIGEEWVPEVEGGGGWGARRSPPAWRVSLCTLLLRPIARGHVDLRHAVVGADRRQVRLSHFPSCYNANEGEAHLLITVGRKSGHATTWTMVFQDEEASGRLVWHHTIIETCSYMTPPSNTKWPRWYIVFSISITAG